MKKNLIATSVVALVIGMSACSDNDSSSTTVAEQSTTSMATSKEATIENAWARTSPMASDVGAVYFDITSPVDDAVIGASVDMSVAMMAQVHKTVMNDDGTMGMKEVDEIALPAGETVNFKIGGNHVMLMQLKSPLELGDTVSLTIELKSGATVVVNAEVQEEAP